MLSCHLSVTFRSPVSGTSILGKILWENYTRCFFAPYTPCVTMILGKAPLKMLDPKKTWLLNIYFDIIIIMIMKKVVPWKQTATQNDVLLLICMFHFLDHFGSTAETNQLWSRRTCEKQPASSVQKPSVNPWNTGWLRTGFSHWMMIIPSIWRALNKSPNQSSTNRGIRW